MAFRTEVSSTEPVTRVEFAVSDSRYPFVAVTEATDGQAMLEEIIPRSGAAYAEFFSVVGADPARVLDLAERHDRVEPRVLNRHENGGLFEFRVEGDCPAVFLSEAGALPRRVHAADGTGRVVAEFPPGVDAVEAVDDFLDGHDGAELLTKHEQPFVTPMLGQRKLQHVVDDALTERQREVLAAANEAGYYEWPREITAEELAAELDISAATLHKHLRAVERELVGVFFDADGTAGHER